MRRAAAVILVAAVVLGLVLAWLDRETVVEHPAAAAAVTEERSAPPLVVAGPRAPAPAQRELPTDDMSPSARWFGFCAASGEGTWAVKRPSLGDALAAVDGQKAAALHQLLVDARAADGRDDPDAALAALRGAASLVPRDPAIALALGRRLAHTPELAAAGAELAIYLAAQSNDREVARLAARLGTAIEIQEGYTRTDRHGVTVLSPPDVDGDAVLALVDASLDDASRLLGAPRRKTLTVVVYPSRAELLAVSCVPAWSVGLYDGTLRLVADVMTSPDTRSRIVRHESLHAALAVAAPRAPTWLHEGLAQYFAGELSPAHVHSYRLMVRERTYIPFASLEGSFTGFDANDAATLAYDQSRAMIDALIERRGERVVADAVEYLRGDAPASGLLPAVGGDFSGDELLEYLARHGGASP